jgi:hypothetical protein
MHALPIPIPTEPLREFCQRNHIRRLAVFGSALRKGDARWIGLRNSEKRLCRCSSPM